MARLVFILKIYKVLKYHKIIVLNLTITISWPKIWNVYLSYPLNVQLWKEDTKDRFPAKINHRNILIKLLIDMKCTNGNCTCVRAYKLRFFLYARLKYKKTCSWYIQILLNQLSFWNPNQAIIDLWDELWFV